MQAIEIQDGADLRMPATLTDDEGPIDLTGYAVDAVDGSGNATQSVAVSILDAAAGTVQITRRWAPGTDRRITFHLRFTEPSGHRIVSPGIMVAWI